MTDNKRTSPAITNAVVWAAMMIATALLLRDVADQPKSMLILLQIAGWFSIDRALAGSGDSLRSCLRRRSGKSSQE